MNIDYQCGSMRACRIEVSERYGDGCHLTIVYSGQPPAPGLFNVALTRDQALELADELVSTAEELGTGMVDRHRNGTTFAYRRHR